MRKSTAYDIARREFYHLRLQEEIELRVAQEEARATGAVFGPSMNEVGMELENQQYERWKEWSEKEAQIQSQKTAAFVGNSKPEAETTGDAEEGAALEPEGAAPVS